MIGDKIAVFIDTNIFERKGFNFNDANQLMKQIKNLFKKNNFEFVVVSVVDEEIKQHILQRKKDSFNKLKKYNSWVLKVLDESIIDENLNKSFIDYEKFKNESKCIYIDLEDISPEIVMKKYFDCSYPFESSKPYEFKDAFFLEAVFKYSKDHELYSGFMVITEDKGVKKAIDEFGNAKILYFNSIEELLDSLVNYPIEEKKAVFDYISKYDFRSQIISKVNVVIDDIKEADISIDSYECAGIYFPKILKVDAKKLLLICDFNINLIGKFSCLDIDNSIYYDNDDEPLVKFYINRDFLSYVCQTLIEVTIDSGQFVDAKIIDFPEILVDYESFLSIDDFIEREM